MKNNSEKNLRISQKDCSPSLCPEFKGEWTKNLSITTPPWEICSHTRMGRFLRVSSCFLLAVLVTMAVASPSTTAGQLSHDLCKVWLDKIRTAMFIAGEPVAIFTHTTIPVRSIPWIQDVLVPFLRAEPHKFSVSFKDFPATLRVSLDHNY